VNEMSYLYGEYDFSLFAARFSDYGREDNFSRTALRAMFDYLSELAEDTGPIKIDVIALCCEWSENTEESICEAYSLENVTEIHNHTTAIELDNGNYLYVAF